MTTSKMKTVVLFFVIAFNFSQSLVDAGCAKEFRITVHVVNNLPSKSPVLGLRCQSKDDDLGYHTLSLYQDYNWSFCLHLFGRTLFFCHLYWGAKQKAFDVFRDKLGGKVYQHHFWSIRGDGIYNYNFSTDVTSPPTKMYDWN
ncbi:hypothetical protein CASFOL_002746 [Castilleja foliolosa]|uniref:S-protein homolog n=1 Tax=Castilleja foliolosa TaxID=1961234 RepID=A0ABD3EIW2_9LAMI